VGSWSPHGFAAADRTERINCGLRRVLLRQGQAIEPLHLFREKECASSRFSDGAEGGS